ncbi:MAG: metallophosphoesterase [Pseudomonadota bacterium]
MKSPFFRKKGNQAPPAPKPESRPRPERPTFVVGDINGCHSALEQILRVIDKHISAHSLRSPHLVFVGNYIDLGPDTAKVARHLLVLTREFPQNVICLMGNHERMLLDFLAEPGLRGARWLRSGGDATLRSFGLEPPQATPEGYAETGAKLAATLPKGLVAWMATRPLSWHSGNLWVVHAGADPRSAMETQSARVLLWGHPEFDTLQRNDGVWVAHGHSDVAEAKSSGGRISVNTAAWRDGTLTAAAIMPDGTTTFLSAQA